MSEAILDICAIIGMSVLRGRAKKHSRSNINESSIIDVSNDR